MAGFLTAGVLTSLLAGPTPELRDQPEAKLDAASELDADEPDSEAGAVLLDIPYLRRPTPRSSRFVDHGVIMLRTAGGTPHRYRLDLQVALFDHLSVGFTTHWLPGQRRPQVWPVGSVAFWRWLGTKGIGFNLGAHYRPVLFPPVDTEQRFVPQAHFGLATMELAAGWFTAGLDVGVAHNRYPLVDPSDTETFRRRTDFGGGIFARLGNRRYGVTFDALAALGPEVLLVFEVAVDVRFGAFEERPRGGWKPGT